MKMSDGPRQGSSYAQTLGRGMQVLETLAEAQRPLTLAYIAAKLGVGRSITYRLVRTLIDHGAVHAEVDDHYALGLGLVTLARGVGTDLRAITQPVLTRVSADLAVTAFLGVVDGNEIVCFTSVEPQSSGLRVSYREGLRHPLGRGASGIAIAAARTPQPRERAAIAEARERGYAISHAELEKDTFAVAAPLLLPHRECRSVVTALFAGGTDQDANTVGPVVAAAAHDIAASLGNGHHLL